MRRVLAAGLLGLALASGPARAEGVPPGSDVDAWSDRWVGDIRLRYDRVDGALVGGRLTGQREGGHETAASAEFTYATGRAKGLYRLEARQSLTADNRLHLDGEFHRLTRPFEYDTEIVGNMENTLAAFFFRNDYRDWYEGQGGRLALRARPARGFGVTLAAAREEQRPLAREVEWGVFQSHRFRENPGATPGQLNTLRLELSHVPYSDGDATGVLPFIEAPRERSGHALRLTAELGGGDFSYTLLRGEARGYWRVTHGQTFTARVMAAAATGHDDAGDLPAQKELYAGGIGTLRGHALKAYRGDRLLLANAEYAVTVYRNFAAFAGLDVGRAWWAADGSSPRFACDAAAGVMTADGRLRAQWGRDTRGGGAPVIFSVRTRATF